MDKIDDSENFEDLLGESNYKKLWKKADDIIETSRTLGEIYDNVPNDLKEVPVKVLEIHIFPKKFKKKINYFLNEEQYPNSLDFIEED
jgi:hypothetical protein